MRGLARRLAPVFLAASLLWAAPASAAQVIGIFPDDQLTVADPAQLTGRRLALPLPDCERDRAGCDEVRLLNQLDGFSVNPRLMVRFSGPIDLDTITRESLFLLPLGGEEGEASGGAPIGLDRFVWEAGRSTLYARPERILPQGQRYVLVVTRKVLDAEGRPLRRAAKGVPALWRRGMADREVVAFSVFTTQSVTADLEKIRAQLDRSEGSPLRFDLSPGGARSVFARAGMSAIEFHPHVAAGGAGPDGPAVRLPLSLVSPSEVGVIAFGRFASPGYLSRERVIPPGPTRSGAPRARETEEVHLTLFLPAGSLPASGWPVAIFGHGYGGTRYEASLTVAGTLARHGIALAAINAVGHGGGPRGLLRVERAGKAPIALPAGGRGLDVDGDGQIGAAEGLGVAPGSPLAIVANRDGLRQTVVDLMQLVRILRRGVDLDGDGHPDLDRDRIYYFGQSLGGIYGTLLAAVDLLVPIAALAVPGGPLVEIARQAPGFRGLLVRALSERLPPLMNGTKDFYEFIPLAGEPPVRNPPPGALAIQAYLDRVEWLHQSANPVAYAPHLRLSPLPGNGPKSVLFQVAAGDRTVPNPTTWSLLVAGNLLPFTSVYRHDRIARELPEAFSDPHAFLHWTAAPAVASIGRAAQEQIARFFLSGGQRIEDPDGFTPRPWGAPLFEVPLRRGRPPAPDF